MQCAETLLNHYPPLISLAFCPTALGDETFIPSYINRKNDIFAYIAKPATILIIYTIIIFTIALTVELFNNVKFRCCHNSLLAAASFVPVINNLMTDCENMRLYIS